MTTAQPIEKNRFTNSTCLESLWDFAAAGFLFLGILTSIGLLLVPLFWGSLLGIPMSLLQAVSTLFGWLVCRSIGEHIRLQKKIAGLTYLGQISGPTSETVIVCSKCEFLLHSKDRCDNCGALIQTTSTETCGH
jgi:hypothetical protein